MSKKTKNIKNLKNKNNSIKDNKGNWEFSFFQKYIIENEEGNIKMNIRPTNIFNPRKIHDYINPQIVREKVIEKKFLETGKISNTENIIYQNYKKINDNKLEKDMNDIKNLGNKAKPITNDGKIHLLMYLLEGELKKNNENNIVSIYLKLCDFVMTDILKDKYKDILDKMNFIILKLDLIELQFTKFSSQMPPLNNANKGFKKFDDWQIDVVNNIDQGISTIVSAPTSAGKSVLSGYTITKGRTLFVVPTDALAWQMASYIGYVTNSDVPIITLTYQSIPKRDDFILKLNSSVAIVGTADLILDYLPFINCNFAWIIFDEIHMMGSMSGSGMEVIAKILPNIPFLALSATIGNLEELTGFFANLYDKKVEYIKCNKRFFNLQKYYYDSSTKKINILNPLSLVAQSQFEDRTILKKTLDSTPTDTWNLVQKLINADIELYDLHPQKYFKSNEIIELTKANEYFNELLEFIVNNYNNDKIKNIISEYINIDVRNSDCKLLDLIFILKEENKSPAIIFQQNTIACLKIVRELSNDIDTAERLKYPNLQTERIKTEKKTRQNNKKIEKELTEKKTKTNNKSEKELDEKKESKNILEIENIVPIDNDLINAPHEDFIFNNESKISNADIRELHEKVKTYFPCIDGDYHFLIRLLWRGIGVYANGLPDIYLRFIQSLASNKKLAIVFSDESLVFGVSMPFRTSVIYHNEIAIDNLNPMIYHQMAGRAGRRGLDKEGNVIFIGYSWDRIKELSISAIPIVKILNKNIYTNNEKYMNKNLNIKWNDKWNDLNKTDINTTQLMWNLRYSNENIIVTFLLPYMQQYFNNIDPTSEAEQIEIAYFLSKFIHIHDADNENDILLVKNYKNINYELLNNELSNLGIEISEYIDGKIWISIRNNLLIEFNNDQLRQRLFDFSIKIKYIQHYCYHNKLVNLTKVLGKLLTRMWWIFHGSSSLLK